MANEKKNSFKKLSCKKYKPNQHVSNPHKMTRYWPATRLTQPQPTGFPSLVNALNEKPLYILEIYGLKKSVN